MFFAHFAAALFFAALCPQIDIVLLYVACSLIDLIHGAFLVAGISAVRPNIESGPYLFADLLHAGWDHSLVMSTVWSLGFALVATTFFYRPVPKHKMSATCPFIFGTACFAASMSHWILDVPVHAPSALPLYPGSPVHFGWDWWNRWGAWSWAAEVAISWILIITALFLAGARTARHTYDQSRFSTILYHGLIIGGILPLIVNPVFSPMKWMALHPEQFHPAVAGMSVIVGFLGPICLINRHVAGYFVDLPDHNANVQAQSPSPSKRRFSQH